MIVEKKGEKSNVALITLNRPKALNALNSALMTDLSHALDELEKDSDVAAIVITGSTKAFAGLMSNCFCCFMSDRWLHLQLVRISKKWKITRSQSV